MIGIVGIIVVFAMVFGGYIAAGGKMGIILHALPFELTMILGAAIGAFLLSNDGQVLKATAGGLKRVFAGPRWKPDDYRDLLCLLFELVRLSRADPLALERHIESPAESEIFARYPKILADRETVDLISDTLRSAAMNFDDPKQVDEVLQARLHSSRHRAIKPAESLRSTADALPALGIVAAVLGVIKTMASIDQPPEVLGKLIGGALVGTFLGVFLSYGFVGPFAARMRAVAEEDLHFHQLVVEVLLANLRDHPPNLCVEVGRQNMPGHMRPDFNDLEEALRGVRAA